ncbi:MAG: hypothetical protein D6734_09210 [Candidatus Schekmanbacteria bacterium]|nr:MAG: hypothetical protein D6734_09210 [Candidatus Schekmanbacteria bacterium]
MILFAKKLKLQNLLIVALCLPLLFACDTGTEKIKKSAEAAKEEVAKSGNYNFFPAKYKKALSLMKKAEKKMKKQQLEKAEQLYSLARKKFLEIKEEGPKKKEKLEANIQSLSDEIEKAKEKAKASIAAIKDTCVKEIANKILGKSSRANELVSKYFEKLKTKAQKKLEQADGQLEKALELQGDETLKKKNRKLKSILETYTTASEIADEICSKTEALAQKGLKKKSKTKKEKKEKSQQK